MSKKSFVKIMMLVLSVVCFCSCSFMNGSDKEEDSIIVNDKSDNILNIGIERVDTLTPGFTRTVSVKQAMEFIFEPLFTFDEGLNPVCVLATSCTPSDDSYSYTLKLREGIEWHDGTPFNAQDVLQTINLIRFQDSPYKEKLSPINSVSIIDNYTLKISVGRPVPNFCTLLTFPVVKATVTHENLDGYIPVGTGPYKYDSKITTDTIKLSKNTSWHDNQPAISEIRLNVLKDKTAVVNAFNASGVDVITTSVIDLKETTPHGEIYVSDYVSNNLVFLGINNQDKFLGEQNTKKAVSYLIDKEEIVTTEIFSRAVVCDVPVNPSAWYYPQVAKAQYDNEYIEDVLSLDGWRQKDGDFVRDRIIGEGEEGEYTVDEYLKTSILVNEDNEEKYRIALKIADTLSEFGIKTDVITVDFASYNERITKGEYSMFIGEIIMPDTMDQYNLLCSENNWFLYNSENMKSAVYSLGISHGSEEQKNAFMNYQKIFSEELPFIPLFFRKESVIFEKSISGTGKPTVFKAFTNPENWYMSRITDKADGE